MEERLSIMKRGSKPEGFVDSHKLPKFITLCGEGTRVSLGRLEHFKLYAIRAHI